MADIQQGRQEINRLKRRLNNYRAHNNGNTHHFESSIDTLYSEQHKQTLILKQRHVESKAKKSNKKSSESKKQDNPLLGVMGQSKLLARTHDQTGDAQENESSVKKQRLINGTSETNAPVSDFQITQQLRNVKSSNSPPVNSNSGQIVNNPSTSNVSNTKESKIEGSSDKPLVPMVLDPEDIKKEGFDLLPDPLFEIFGSIRELDDIKFDEIVQNIGFDQIHQEDGNSTIDMYLKEEVAGALDDFFDPIVKSDSDTTRSSVPPISISKSSPGNPQFSNTPPMSHASTPPFTSTSTANTYAGTSSLPQQTASTPSNASFPNSMTKIRMNSMPIGQSDGVLAAQTLMQMAEVHQTKQSPSSNSVRPDYSFSNMSGPQMMTTSNQMYSNMNQNNPIYNQGVNTEMEIKRRQLVQSQQYSMQQQVQQQSSMTRPPVQNMNLTQSTQKETTPTSTPQQNQSPLQQTQQSPSSQQQPSTQPQSSQSQRQQSQSVAQGNQSVQLTSGTGMPGYSNRLSPMNSYAQPSSQMAMSNQYGANMCTGMTPSNIRGSFPNQTQVSSPVSSSPQGAQNGMLPMNQPRYMQQQQQQMIGNVGMMRSQMMARPPPPEYRQAAMMQQHQAMMGQGMSQIHQGMNQVPVPYQNMRSGYRPGMPNNPINSMTGGQMMSQQTIPGNMKASSMVGSMNQGGPMSGGIPSNGMSMNQATMGMSNSQSAAMQRTRPPNMGTQMPPSRPEWRHMIMQQQNQGGIMMTPSMRHQYQQAAQQGAMINQGGQMISMQRSQMMNMMNMQPSGMHHNNSGMTLGSRVPQHVAHQQGQIRMGVPMNQAVMSEGRGSTNLGHNVSGNLSQLGGSQPMGGGNNLNQMGGSPVMSGTNNLNQMVGSPVMGSGNSLGQMVGSPVMSGGNSLSQMGGSPVMSGGNSLSQMGGSPTMSGGNLNQMGGSPVMGGGNNLSQMGPSSTMSTGNNQMRGSPSSLSGGNTLSTMGGSPAMSGGNNLNQMVGSPTIAGANINPMVHNSMSPSTMNVGASSHMNQTNHPRSPATMVQMHPRSPAASSNTVGQSRPLSNPSFASQANSASGNSSPMTVSSQNRVPIMSGNIAPSRTSNTMIQVNQPVPPLGLMPNQASSHRPDSRGNSKSSQPPTPNPPASSASAEFDDFLSNEGEFASLLN